MASKDPESALAEYESEWYESDTSEMSGDDERAPFDEVDVSMDDDIVQEQPVHLVKAAPVHERRPRINNVKKICINLPDVLREEPESDDDEQVAQGGLHVCPSAWSRDPGPK